METRLKATSLARENWLHLIQEKVVCSENRSIAKANIIFKIFILYCFQNIASICFYTVLQTFS